MREDAHERERYLGEATERHIIGGGATDSRECDEEKTEELKKKNQNLHSRTPGVGSGSRVRWGYSREGCGVMPELRLEESDRGARQGPSQSV